jgi:hypothetical protein
MSKLTKRERTFILRLQYVIRAVFDLEQKLQCDADRKTVKEEITAAILNTLSIQPFNLNEYEKKVLR